MKSGQCPKCGSRDVFCNTNRKFPALNTITVGTGIGVDRYACLDTYICSTCGYIENYVAKLDDLNYIKQEWTKVDVKCDSSLEVSSDMPALVLSVDGLHSKTGNE
jgi:predicted nucleic-acid-binding Zn-ribbon protein